jgi:excisionase family DNA binding protein
MSLDRGVSKMKRSSVRAVPPRQQRAPLLYLANPFHTKLLYTPEEAAELLSISRSRLYILMARAAISSIKEGRIRLIPAAALDEYLQRRLAEQAPLLVVSEPLRLVRSHEGQG